MRFESIVDERTDRQCDSYRAPALGTRALKYGALIITHINKIDSQIKAEALIFHVLQ